MERGRHQTAGPDHSGRPLSVHLITPLLLGLMWGLNWPAVKIALSGLPPFTFRALGMSAAAVLVLGWTALRGGRIAIPRRSWGNLAIAGVLNVALFNILVTFAQLATLTSRAAILTFTMPFWATLFARLWLGERLDRTRGLALAVGGIGLVLLALPLLTSPGNGAALLWPLAAAIGWAAGTVFTKGAVIEGDRLAATGWQLTIGGTVASVGALLAGEQHSTWHLTPSVTVALVFHILLPMSLAYGLWFRQLARTSASESAMTTLLIPVVGVASAMLLLGDRPNAADLAGFAAILASSGLLARAALARRAG